jgi:hypothetical protein
MLARSFHTGADQERQQGIVLAPFGKSLPTRRYLRIAAEDRSRHANRAFGFATADVGVGERTLPT